MRPSLRAHIASLRFMYTSKLISLPAVNRREDIKTETARATSHSFFFGQMQMEGTIIVIPSACDVALQNGA